MPVSVRAPDAPMILMVAFEAGRSGPARLPKSLAAAGFRVAVLCPADNALAATHFCDLRFPLDDVLNSHRVARRLAAAMDATRPTLVIPCDERAVACLQALVLGGRSGVLRPWMITTLTDSLGDPAFFDALLMKSDTLTLARRIGIATPDSLPAANAAEARAAAARLGGAVYLKASFGWAGQAVIGCRTEAEIDAAMATLAPRRSWLRDVARRALHRDWYPVATTIDVQTAVDGTPAMVAAVAWRGQMLAAFSGRPEATLSATGPSCVVWIGAQTEMEAAAAAFIAATGASGYLGFDFLVERSGGRPLLLECNPRPIQIGHLGDRIGVDLARALAAGLHGDHPSPTPAAGTAEIALFPNGRQAARPGVLLDTPEDDDALVVSLLRTAAV